MGGGDKGVKKGGGGVITVPKINFNEPNSMST